MLNDAANVAAELLGVDKKDPSFQEAVKIAGEVIGLKYDN